MANRLGSRGLMFVGADRHVGERNKFIEAEIALWIEALIDDCIPPRPFDQVLRDGVLLCRAINVLKPGSVAKIAKPFTKDAYTQNLSAFIKGAESFGVPSDKLFAPADLVEGENIPKVINCLLTLARLCYEKGWEGPALGPKPTGANKDWPESILRASEAIIPLQYGTNKFASQKGMRIGGARDVLPHIKGLKKEGEEEPKDGEPRNNPSESILPMQCGSFRGATQKGLKIGTIRDVLPHIVGGELPKKEGEFNLTESILPMQCGSFRGATQKGLMIGTIRDVLPHIKYRTADTQKEVEASA